jgi:hypothetical protein
MDMSRHHLAPVPLSFFPKHWLVSSTKPRFLWCITLIHVAYSPHVLFALFASHLRSSPNIVLKLCVLIRLLLSLPSLRLLYPLLCPRQFSTTASSPYKILGLPDIFNSSREIREPWKTRSISHHARISPGLLGKLTKLAKGILPTKKPYPEGTRHPQEPAPAPGHPQEPDPAPSHPQEPDPVPSQPSSTWKSKAKNLAIDFGVGAAGTLAGNEILSQRPSADNSTDSTNPANATDPAGLANSTTSTSPYSTNSTNSTTPNNSNTDGLQRRALVYGKRLSHFSRMLDELD